MYLVFDTETTGLPRDWNAPITDTDNWPRCVQLAWQVHDEMGELVEVKNYIIKPEGYTIPYNAEKIHGISTERAMRQGMDLSFVLEEFNKSLSKAKFVQGHNVGFDISVMGSEYYRKGIDSPIGEIAILDSCTENTAALCAIPGGRGGKFKLPTLTELHTHLFNEAFNEAHNASADVEATARCFLELVRIGRFKSEELGRDDDYIRAFREHNPKPFELIGLNIQPYLPDGVEFDEFETSGDGISDDDLKKNAALLEGAAFAHLHNHSQFSILQATSEINALVSKAAAYKMPAVALTDTGNMMAVYHFVKAVFDHNKKAEAKNKELEEAGQEPTETIVKPIVGCEFNVCKDRNDKSKKDNGSQVVLLAKNRAGYHNLAKMASIAYTEGFYYVPRIDRSVIETYKEDIICLTGNLYGEVPSMILNIGETQAEEALLWWKEQFGQDLYIELMRHGQDDEDNVNKTLVTFSKKHDIKVVATNNTYYINKDDANAHDILLCVKDGQKQSTPIGRGRGYRYGFPNQEYYFKTQEEMKECFQDLPEAILNIEEIVEQIEPYQLARDVLLPAFDIPEEFQDEQDQEDGGKRGENNFLRHLTYEGALKRYGEIDEVTKERLDFELETIARTGYPGYFLIVQDFCQAARDMGVSVGPGRGSAAGSAVAYCIGITNVDPIKYDLLFERFLNPDRVSLPDIDIDFDDEGRGDVINWVIDKYGANQVAQIITYGTMAAKSAIRDTGRVLDLPLPDTDRIAKLVPDLKLKKLFKMDDKSLADKLKGNVEDIQRANELKGLSKGDDLVARTINQAHALEGSVRNTGIHACGVIITPDDITKYVPVAVAKDSDMWCTQFDNSVVENAGLLKMDFLGLKTLTLIKDACRNVKARHNIDLDPDSFPMDDVPTYELFQRGETIGIFQYESAGMQKYMRELKPTVFADLIAMNALYRPGPLEYIPSFIKRKHGEEEIEYDLDDMKEYLEETYGITVYQEQVMLLSQKLAGFTKGEADMLRKAMGKKIFALLEQLKPKFINQAAEKGHNKKSLEKIWKDWEAFASYAFNKSHSTCYAWVAYQTAYLKAHYPAEYMASVLSNNMNDIKQVTFFMEECRRAGIPVLGPDVNESNFKFTVNEEGAIRFGLGALKGVGGPVVDAIIQERGENGMFNSVFDVAKRVDRKKINKKAFESLALGGGFDQFEGIKREQFFAEDNGRLFLDTVVKYGSAYQHNKNSAQVSLFGESSEVDMPEPLPPICPDWNSLTKLRREKEVVGVYISGHPLDDFKKEVEYFCNSEIKDIKDLSSQVGREIKFAGIVTEFAHLMTKTGKPYGKMTIEDYSEAETFFLFSDDYKRFSSYMIQDLFVYVVGKAQPRRWGGNEGQLEFKLTKMDFLAEVMEKQTSQLTIDTKLESVDQQLIDSLDELLVTYSQGNCRVFIRVFDTENKLKVEFRSRTKTIGISPALIKALDSFERIKYKLA